MADVLLYCDGSPETGVGHFRRTLSLYHYLKRQQIHCIIRCLSKEGAAYFSQLFPQLNERHDNILEDDIKLVVFDVPYPLTSQVAVQQKKGRGVICLDCLFVYNLHSLNLKFICIEKTNLKPLLNENRQNADQK